MTQEEESQVYDVITLVNKRSGAKITVPKAIIEGARYYIISEEVIEQSYHMGNMYLDKDYWEIAND